MARQFGLRTEIIVNLCILMGAALLFSGFLVLNLLERELVRNYTENARQHLTIAARLAESLAEERTLAVRRALAGSPADWFLFDPEMKIIALSPSGQSVPVRREDVKWTRFEEEAITHLDYTSFYFPFGTATETLTVTVPLRANGHFAGALQARFPLTPVKDTLASVTRLYLFFLVLYGGILLLFGFWLLGKTIVRPVRRLTAATARIAEGELQPVGVPEGPREIVEMAHSFNHMTMALKESRAKTDESIVSLRQANDELRQTRDELVRSERLASVGHLAAGMAHEIGNPLGAIIGYLDLLRSELPPGREREISAHAGAEAERIDRLIRELLDYARPDMGNQEPSEPVDVLSEAIQLLTHQGSLAGIEVEIDLPATLPRVAIARHKLLQVFVNLLINARDALRSAGRGEGDFIRLSGGELNGEVWLAVADNGDGIEPADLSFIFDPFFTSKAPGEGRGLGLAICHRIIAEAGGRIDVISKRMEGSRFTVSLPSLTAEGA